MHYKTTTINLGKSDLFLLGGNNVGSGGIGKEGGRGGGRPQHANIATYRLNRPRS